MSDLRAQVQALPWHHQIDFGGGILSPGYVKIGMLKALADLYFSDGVVGKSVLDIGCWDGFNSFEAKRRGASRVLATDHFAWSDSCWASATLSSWRGHTWPPMSRRRRSSSKPTWMRGRNRGPR